MKGFKQACSNNVSQSHLHNLTIMQNLCNEVTDPADGPSSHAVMPEQVQSPLS